MKIRGMRFSVFGIRGIAIGILSVRNVPIEYIYIFIKRIYLRWVMGGSK